jgi:hypothetical protein
VEVRVLSWAPIPIFYSVLRLLSKVILSRSAEHFAAIPQRRSFSHYRSRVAARAMTPRQRNTRAPPSFRDAAVRPFHESDKDCWITEFCAPLGEIGVSHATGTGAHPHALFIMILSGNFVSAATDESAAINEDFRSQIAHICSGEGIISVQTVA